MLNVCLLHQCEETHRSLKFVNGLPASFDVYMNKKSSSITSELFLKWITEQFIWRNPVGKILFIMMGIRLIVLILKC